MSDGVNRVPAAPIVAILKTYLCEQENLALIHTDGERWQSPLQNLAHQADVNYNTLYRYIEIGDRHSMNFNYADRLLCAIGKAQVWFGELREVYFGAVLADEHDDHFKEAARPSGKRVCAARDCPKLFVPHKKSPKQQYCSNACKHREYRLRKGRIKTAPRGPGRKLESTRCAKGHWRDPGAALDSNGHRYCRDCHREQMRRFRAKKRGALLAA